LLASSILYSYLNIEDPLSVISKFSPIMILAGLLLSLFFMGGRGAVEVITMCPMGISAVAMAAVSLALAIPIPSPWGSSIMNSYYGYSSVLYLVSTILMAASNWLTSKDVTQLYSDLDQLEGITVRLKSGEETSREDEEVR